MACGAFSKAIHEGSPGVGVGVAGEQEECGAAGTDPKESKDGPCVADQAPANEAHSDQGRAGMRYARSPDHHQTAQNGEGEKVQGP